MKRVLTDKDLVYIEDNYLNRSYTDIAIDLDVAKGTVMSAARKLGLKRPKGLSNEFRKRGVQRGYDNVIHEYDDIIKEKYFTTPIKTLAAQIDKSDTYVRGRLNKLGLIIPEDVVEQRKKDSQIKKGAVPPNKGKKQKDYMSAEQIAKTIPTRFKKGQRPHNTKADGIITTRRETLKTGEKRPYKWIRISEGNWKKLHVKVWEDANGPVPEGHIIVFKDKDTMNITLDNLECITIAENMERNTLHNLPEELKEIHVLKAVINRRINKIEDGK